MRASLRIAIVAVLAVLVAGAIVFRDRHKPEASAPTANQLLPKLLDLGADKCIPCKAMAPILAELKRDYASRFVTEFVDVWRDEGAGKRYGVEMIPTQIFFDATGKELYRHVGFYSKEDILAKWQELGVK
jgi:thioredoxin 1